MLLNTRTSGSEMPPPIQIVAYACGIGGQFAGSRDGPAAFRNHIEQFADLRKRVGWHSWIEDGRAFSELGSRQVLESVITLSRQLAQASFDIVTEGGFPVLIGGDHSAAAGYWSGICAALAPEGDVGLIWIDAHMDSHTPQTSPNGYVHGMPLAALLGHGHQGLTTLLSERPKLKPAHVCLIGTRDYEPEEKALLQSLGVRIFFMDEIHYRGLPAVFEDALHLVRQASRGYGVTIDLDGLNPEDAPGVSTPAANGLAKAELLTAMQGIYDDPRLVGMEISEFNPANDIDNRTLTLMHALLAGLHGKRDGRT